MKRRHRDRASLGACHPAAVPSTAVRAPVNPAEADVDVVGIGNALDATGAAQALAAGTIALTGDAPQYALAMVFGATALLTAVATNNVAAVVMFPIALAAANALGANFMPFAVTIMMAASASFATPVGYQTNLMVYGAGGYRFSDYLRIGVPLTVLIGLVTVLLTPLFWPF